MWRYVVGFAFPTFRRFIMFTLWSSSSLRKKMPRDWNRVLLRICHFLKSMELHSQQRVVTPQNNSTFHNTAVRISVFKLYFLTESPASLLPFVMYSHILSTSRPTTRPSTYKFSLSLNHSLTYSLPSSVILTLPPPPHFLLSPTLIFLPTHFHAISFRHWFTLPFTRTLHLLIIRKHILCVASVQQIGACIIYVFRTHTKGPLNKMNWC